MQLGGRVTYPGLPHHPQHALLARLANPGAVGWGVEAAYDRQMGRGFQTRPKGLFIGVRLNG